MVEQTRTCSVFYIGVSDRYLLAQDAGALNFDYAEVFLGSFHYYNLAQCGIRKHYNWNFDISDLSKRIAFLFDVKGNQQQKDDASGRIEWL